MINKKLHSWSQSSIPYIKIEDDKVLSKMYPGIDTSNKYILFLKFELYWRYLADEVEASIEVVTEDGFIDLPNYKIRTPYPNKCYHVPCMRYKNNLSDKGIPIIFDSFEKLNKIKHIKCSWKVKYNNVCYYLQVLYDVFFVKEENRNVYGISSREVDIHHLLTEEAEKSVFKGVHKFEEYDKVFHIKNKSDKIIADYIKGTPATDVAEEEIFITTFSNLNTKDFIRDPKMPFYIDSYYSKEILIPDISTTMLN